MHLSNIPPFQVSLPIFPQPIQISPVILDNYNLKLTLQQPLFTGFRLLSLRSAAKSNYKASQLDYNSETNEVAYKIQNAFWNYYKAAQNDKVLTDNLQQINQHLSDTKNFLSNGLATQNDVLKLEVQYSSTKLQKIEADNNLDIARTVFNQAVGLPLESETEIETNAISTQKNSDNLNELIAEAKNNRSELKALNSRVEASQQGVRAAESTWFPSIYLIGDYYYSKPNQRIIPAVNKFKDTWDVGVSLSWSLWNWGNSSAQTTIAEQNKIQAETSLSQLKDAVEIEVYQNYLTFKRAYDKVNVAKLGVEQAEENYRMINEKYNTQVATSTDLIDSEVSLLQAKTNYNNALVDYEMAKVRLDKSIGRKIY
jgi:outer membrane protein TolC